MYFSENIKERFHYEIKLTGFFKFDINARTFTATSTKYATTKIHKIMLQL